MAGIESVQTQEMRDSDGLHKSAKEFSQQASERGLSFLQRARARRAVDARLQTFTNQLKPF
jgi:hypothetical protein